MKALYHIMNHNSSSYIVGNRCGPQNHITQNQAQISLGQYWLDKSQPKQAFGLTCCYIISNKLFYRFFADWLNKWLSNWLMPSDKPNSTTAIRCLIFSLFDVAWHTTVHTMHSSHQCPSFIFADSERCWFGGTCDGFLCVTEIIHNFPLCNRNHS